MHRTLTYRSPTTGQDIIFDDGSSNVIGTALDIREFQYDWKTSTTGVITGGGYKPMNSELKVVIVGEENADHIVDVLESDSLSGNIGTLTDENGWTAQCICNGISVKEYAEDMFSLNMSMLFPDGCWRKSTTIHLRANSGTIIQSDGKDYPHDYGFDYQADSRSTVIEVSGAYGALLGIKFFGPCSNPYVSIGGNRYGVNADAETYGRIVVDPLGRKKIGGSVYSVDRYGNVTNLYSSRLRGYEGSGTYIFQRLSPGSHTVSWNQSTSIDLELIEERGTPPWN